ncbi:MAG: hypothetical protein ACAH83_04315 [Alphaproteobacteria bacterium]
MTKDELHNTSKEQDNKPPETQKSGGTGAAGSGASQGYKPPAPKAPGLHPPAPRPPGMPPMMQQAMNPPKTPPKAPPPAEVKPEDKKE